MSETCSTCRWWQGFNGEGFCHRYPPFIVRPGDRFFEFPLIRARNFCGEHQPKEGGHG